jgi:hypothetical protein
MDILCACFCASSITYAILVKFEKDTFLEIDTSKKSSFSIIIAQLPL